MPEPVSAPAETTPRELRFSSKIWAAILVACMHAAVLLALLTYRHVVNVEKPPEALVLLDIAAPRPPEQQAPPEIPDIAPVVIPPPVVEIENRPPSITAVVMETPPPPAPVAPVVKAESPPAPPAAPAPAVAADLSSSMIEAAPPRYPLESRRLKEQGTVVLELLLGLDGRVERILVRTSSGSNRLDQAALNAVRKWRWSPTVRNGTPVAVRGLVEIPFVLAPHH
ncbi:energy transducer TonB [Sandaracinobacteroides hominis]|uniref:energy transducer TonB n=1 Tax=Sandaracinobacteroides hominis TaxID=2780086 RepID=UPI0018F36CE6|nr:energy transducer TonB [Sandaracinobacteroides hominis]